MFCCRSLCQLIFHMSYHLLGGLERAVVRTLTSFSQASVNDTTLPRSVLIVGRWKLGYDVDNATGHLEFQSITNFDTSPTLNTWGHHKLTFLFCFFFEGDGHWFKRNFYAAQ